MSLRDLTVPELRQKCKELGITGYSKKPKDTLIRMIEEARAIAKDLQSMSVKELRRQAKEAGITGYSRMRKDDLIRELGNKPVSIQKEESQGVTVKCHVTLLNRDDFVGKTIKEVMDHINNSSTEKMVLNLPDNYMVILNGSTTYNSDYVLQEGDELEFVARTGSKG